MLRMRMPDDDLAIRTGRGGTDDVLTAHSSAGPCGCHASQINTEIACQVPHWGLG